MRIHEQIIREAILHPDKEAGFGAVLRERQGFGRYPQDGFGSCLLADRDATIHAVAEMYREGDERLRRAACYVLEHVHSDLAVSTALEFLPQQKDPTMRAFLAGALASHFAFEALEPLRQLVLDGSYDDNYADLKRDVVIATTVMNVELPERERWKVEVEQKRLERRNKILNEKARRLEEEVHRLKLKKKRLERQKRLLLRQPTKQDEFEEERPLPPKNKIGRNDPCPCGSGKKFKKCCLKKQGLSPLD